MRYFKSFNMLLDGDTKHMLNGHNEGWKMHVVLESYWMKRQFKVGKRSGWNCSVADSRQTEHTEEGWYRPQTGDGWDGMMMKMSMQFSKLFIPLRMEKISFITVQKWERERESLKWNIRCLHCREKYILYSEKGKK